MKLIPFLFFLTLIFSSCNQLYRGIPKAPRQRIIAENKTPKSTQLDEDLSLNENLSQEVEFKDENQNSTFIESENSLQSEVNKSNEKQGEFIMNSDSKIVKDTLIVDADVLEKGENCVRLQTVANVGTSLMFLIFFLSIIFIAVGIYNIYRYNNLPYVSQGTDARMQRKIKNFYIALGIYLFLILLIIALFIFI